MFECKLCNQEFKNAKSLNAHIVKGEKTRLVNYYHEFYPRYDKHTKGLLLFKSYDFYFNNDFNSRSNFLKWFVKSIKDKKTEEYCYKKLSERIKEKKFTYTPSHIELSTVSLPNLLGFDEIGGIDKYIKFCENDYNLKTRYSYKKERVRNSNKKISIIVDTREQNPLLFDSPTIRQKLDFGDYAIKGSELAIERKSLNDFVGTMISGYERFKREIERSGYLVVLVESSLKSVVNFMPPYGWKTNKIQGSLICRQMRELCQSYNNIQFLFTKNRKESADACKKILKMEPNKIKAMDLQWLHDQKILI